MHEHETPKPCEHELKHCAKCDVVYCEKCKYEWKRNASIWEYTQAQFQKALEERLKRQSMENTKPPLPSFLEHQVLCHGGR